MSRVRVETRSRHQSDLRRVMHSTEKVRKWEKKWVRVEETSLQIFKWMPIIKKDEQNPQQPQQPQQQQLQQQQQQHPMPQQQTNTTFNTELQTIPFDEDRRGFSHLESNKRPHENDGVVVDLPDSKRAKTSDGFKVADSAEPLSDSRMLAPMQTVEARDVKYEFVSSRPEVTEVPKADEEMVVPHLAAVTPSVVTQPDVRSTMTSEVTACSSADQSMTDNDVTFANTNGGDYEAMDTDEIEVGDSARQTPSANLNTPQVLDTEDFSSIARTVTEQIVLKVSNCYGGDS